MVKFTCAIVHAIKLFFYSILIRNVKVAICNLRQDIDVTVELYVKNLSVTASREAWIHALQVVSLML